MQHLPLGIQTFEKIRTENYLYVDKTAMLIPILREGTFYFLSRPRRFGKSLLLSTLASYFEGKKELFEGLALASAPIEWKKHPVIHIDFSQIEYRNGGEIFEASLIAFFENIAKTYGLELKSNNYLEFFVELVPALYEKLGSVVILVDEYDKPLVDVLEEPQSLKENRSILNGLYASMKSFDKYLRLVFLTGVSRFSKVGVFSGMNNLTDISLGSEFNGIVGFTESDVLDYFSEYIDSLEAFYEDGHDSLMAQIKKMYNGYSWDGIGRIYNPYSLLSLFKTKVFNNYWYNTGTPTFLAKYIANQNIEFENFKDKVFIDLVGDFGDIEKIPVIPLLFQTGYLTIDTVSFHRYQQRFTLRFPNKEVEDSFHYFLVSLKIGQTKSSFESDAVRLRDALETLDINTFEGLFNAFLASIPAKLHMNSEAYYHSLLYLMLRLVGLKMRVEQPTSLGFIDAVLELEDRIIIFELKFATNKRVKNIDTLIKKAHKQILDKEYAASYLHQSKPVFALAFGFLNKKMKGQIRQIKS